MPNLKRLQLLVNALCSGNYEQGQGQLKKGIKYCCLGLACELYRQQTSSARWVHNGREFAFSDSCEATTYVMTNRVRQWYGLPSTTPDDFLLHGGDLASALNDEGHSFREISTKIVRTYPGLTLPPEE